MTQTAKTNKSPAFSADHGWRNWSLGLQATSILLAVFSIPYLQKSPAQWRGEKAIPFAQYRGRVRGLGLRLDVCRPAGRSDSANPVRFTKKPAGEGGLLTLATTTTSGSHPASSAAAGGPFTFC